MRYYAVYGTEQAGLFDNWDDVEILAQGIEGFHTKKFKNSVEALNFLLSGVIRHYMVNKRSQINNEKLLNNLNKLFFIEELLKE